MSQHPSLTPKWWAVFTLDQPLMMIGNEMHRARKFMALQVAKRLRRAYERALSLTDLTVQIQTGRNLRREPLRWRDLIARFYLESAARPADHAAAFRALRRFSPVAARQIPYVLEGSGPPVASR